MINSRTLTTVSVLALTLACAAPAWAGEITGVTPFPGINSIAGVSNPPPVAPNNDNVAGDSPNGLLVTQKDYAVNAPVDLVFDVTPTGGVTEYTMSEGVSNSSGVPWSGYTIQLGFGVGTSFVPSTPGDGLDFDSLDFDSPPDLTAFFPVALTVTEDEIIGSGGIFPNGAFTVPDFTFNIDVPDTFSQFTLRQFPIPVPEPASMALLGLGAVAALRRRSH